MKFISRSDSASMPTEVALVHLDANFLMRFATGQREVGIVQDWTHRGVAIAASSIAWTEFLCGPVREDAIGLLSQVVGAPVLYDAVDASRAATLFNETGRRRGSLRDCMIAAVAIRANADIATNNVRDFERFAPFGLRIAV